MRKRFFYFGLLGLAVILIISNSAAKAQTVPATAPVKIESTVNAETPAFLSFLKNLVQNIRLILTTDQIKKAEMQLKSADDNIAALENLCDEQKCDSIEKIQKYLNQFEEKFQKGIDRLEKAKQQGKDVASLIEQLKENHLRQQDVLGKVLEKAPASAQPAILNAIEKSSSGLENAISKIEGQERVSEFQARLNSQLNNLGEAAKNKIKEKIKSKIQEKTDLIEQRLNQPDAAPIKELRDTVKKQGEPLYQQGAPMLEELEKQVNALKNQDSKKIISTTLIFFYGSGCPHCQIVEKYFADNKIAEKIKFDQKEVYAHPKNSALLVQYAKKCGINENEIGVPLLWNGSKCAVGDQAIIDYFQTILGLK